MELEENENESKLVAESENDSEDTQSQNDVDGSLWKFDSDDDADVDDAKHPERMSFTPNSARILIKAPTLSRYLKPPLELLVTFLLVFRSEFLGDIISTAICFYL